MPKSNRCSRAEIDPRAAQLRQVCDERAVGCYVKPLHKLAVGTAKANGKISVEPVGDCKIPFAPDQIKNFEARSAIGKKRKSPKC